MTRSSEVAAPGTAAADGAADLEARLRQIGERADSDIDLAETGLLLAAYRQPGLDLERYRHHLSLLVRDTGELGRKHAAGGSLAARAEVLRAVLAERYGYAGDKETYDDLQNADLARVIDRRMGLPVALGLLYVHTAERQGWPASGINFPGHFMIRLTLGGDSVILDPLNGGVIRTMSDLGAMLRVYGGGTAELAPQHTAAVGRRELLLRLQNNIKLRLLAAGRTAAALEALDTMIMLAPADAEMWREAGVLQGELGNLRAAIASLQHSLQLGLEPSEAAQATDLLQQFRSRLH
jgi:regulator of sirC expression with transglutaminase-like and TPR domain